MDMEIRLKFTERSLAKSLKFGCTARYGSRRRSSNDQMGQSGEARARRVGSGDMTYIERCTLSLNSVGFVSSRFRLLCSCSWMGAWVGWVDSLDEGVDT